MAQTMAEHLIERGKAQGFEQGETRGKQEALLKLLRFRFGSIPEYMTNEITLIQSLSHLDMLLRRR